MQQTTTIKMTNAIIEIDDLNIGQMIDSSSEDGFTEMYLPWISACGILVNITIFVFSVVKFCHRRNGELIVTIQGSNNCNLDHHSLSELYAFFAHIAVLDIINLALMPPEVMYVQKHDWWRSSTMCACFSGLEAYVNVAMAYTMLTIILQVLIKLRREEFLHILQDDAISDDDSFDDEESAYEIADNFQQKSLTFTTVYQRIDSRPSTMLMILLPTLLAGSVSVPYFLFSQIIPAKPSVDLCVLRDSSDSTLNIIAQVMILLLRVVVPILSLLITIIATIFKYARTQESLSKRTVQHYRAAIVLTLIFLFCSSTHLLQNAFLLNYRTLQPYIAPPFVLSQELVLYSTMLHYAASLLMRPLFVLLSFGMDLPNACVIRK